MFHNNGSILRSIWSSGEPVNLTLWAYKRFPLTSLGRSHSPCSYYWDRVQSQSRLWWYNPFIWEWFREWWCWMQHPMLIMYPATANLSWYFSHLWRCCFFNLVSIAWPHCPRHAWPHSKRYTVYFQCPHSQVVLNWPKIW
jgi:hypothetical protein